MDGIDATPEVAASRAKKKPFYTSLSWQVLFGIAVAIVLGILRPATAVAMKPLGDGFTDSSGRGELERLRKARE